MRGLLLSAEYSLLDVGAVLLARAHGADALLAGCLKRSLAAPRDVAAGRRRHLAAMKAASPHQARVPLSDARILTQLTLSAASRLGVGRLAQSGNQQSSNQANGPHVDRPEVASAVAALGAGCTAEAVCPQRYQRYQPTPPVSGTGSEEQ